MNICRGDLWLTEFESSVGTETKKTRPALIVSNNISNDKSSKVTVVPLSSSVVSLPIVVVVEPDSLNGLRTKSTVRVPDVCTFDKRRLKGRIGMMKEEYMKEVDRILRLHLAL